MFTDVLITLAVWKKWFLGELQVSGSVVWWMRVGVLV